MSFGITGPVTEIPYVAGEKFTEENHAAEADINFIVDQFTRTGVLSHNAQHEGAYGNFISGDVYELAQDAIANANSMYQSLPFHIRQQFPEGTPQFLDFIQDPQNREEIAELGLTTAHLPEEMPSTDPTPRAAPETPPAAPEAVSEALNTPQE